MLRRRVSGHAGLPTDVEVFSLVLGVVRLLFVSGTHVRYFLVVFSGSIGVWRSGSASMSKSRRVSTDWGDAGAGFGSKCSRSTLALTERSTFHHVKNWRPQFRALPV